MSHALLIRGARQLITLGGPPGPRRGADMQNLSIIQDGAVLVIDGTIRDVGPARRVERLASARDAIEIDASGKVVMPGFVDSHTCLVGGPLAVDQYEAGQTPDTGSMLLDNIRQVRSYSKQRMALEARKQIRQFVRYGTTTLDAHTGFGLDQTSELKLLRVIEEMNDNPLSISSTFYGANSCPESTQPEEYVGWLANKMLPEVSRRKLARFVDVACGTTNGFEQPQAARVLGAAHECGFSLRVNTGPYASTQRAVSLAVDHEAASIDGLVEASPADIAALAASRTVATLLPGHAFHSGSAVHPPARALIDGGATIAIATGFDPFLGPSCSMPMMLSLACTQMKMTPAEALTASTVNAACALLLEHRTGSLQAGKDADLLLLSTGDYREAICRFGMNLVAMVIRRGEVVFPRVGSV
jgi:imidazolonepropionase